MLKLNHELTRTWLEDYDWTVLAKYGDGIPYGLLVADNASDKHS